jgi:hypothetical protein
MRRATAVALLVIGMALPVCAQRGMSHGGGASGGFHGGGFSSHSAPAFHGGFGAAAPSRYSGSPRAITPRYGGTAGLAANRPRSFSPAYRMRSAAGNRAARPAYVRDGHDYRDGRNGRNPHRPYRPVYRSGFVYAAPQYGWIGPDYFGYPNDAGYDDGTSYPDYAANGDYTQPGDQEPPPPYLPLPQPEQPETASAPVAENSEAITLVFKDGRASEQIHNYILSRTTLSVLDGNHQDIPVDALDLAATEKVNRGAGVDFRLPNASR